jgi:glycosyltransferase involved in cell wall biosynthesis
MPLVSLCIPTHSAKRLPYLREAVASLRNQTHSDTEILLWDNGHDEPLYAFAQDQIRQDSRVRYHRHERSVSISANFDEALQAARGEYVVMIGDDDRLLPHAVEAQLASTTAEATVTFSNVYIIGPDGRRLQKETQDCLVRFGRERMAAGRVADPVAAAWANSVVLPGALLHAGRMKRHGFNRTLRSCDLVAFIELASGGHTFIHVPEYLVEYRVHAGSVTVGGSLDEPLFPLLVGLDVPPHVLPLKRQLLGRLLEHAVGLHLANGEIDKAHALLDNPYYPTLRERPTKAVVHRALAALPASIARSSVTAMRTLMRHKRMLLNGSHGF